METRYPTIIDFLAGTFNHLRSIILLGVIVFLSSNVWAKFKIIDAMDFTTTTCNNHIQLAWFAWPQTSISYFVVEKSYDGKNFKDAAIIFADKNGSAKLPFIFNDKISESKHKTVYYRLRVVDSSEIETVSDIRKLRIAKVKSQIVSSPFVNTITDSIILTMPKYWQGKNVVYEIYNSKGEEVKNWEKQATEKRIHIGVSDLTDGKYMLRVNCSGQEFFQRFIKARP